MYSKPLMNVSPECVVYPCLTLTKFDKYIQPGPSTDMEYFIPIKNSLDE